MWWKFALPVAATCVLAVGLGVWTYWRPLENGPAIVQRTASDVPLNPEVGPKPEVRLPGPAGRLELARARIKARTIPEGAAEPEVIVPADRALALARFLELAREGALNEETLKPIASAPPATVLEIKPIVVTPLSVPELEPQSGASEPGADRE
jgi:hypothetical protein